MHCLHCQASNPLRSRFCYQCGAILLPHLAQLPVSPTAAPLAQVLPPPAPPIISKVALWGLFGIVLSCGFCGMCGLLLSPSKTKTDDSLTNVSTEGVSTLVGSTPWPAPTATPARGKTKLALSSASRATNAPKLTSGGARSEEKGRVMQSSSGVRRVRGGQRGYITGPRGGCYYINGNGNKTYVDHSYCR